MIAALEKVSLLYFGKKGALGEIEIDAFIKESHEHKAKVTEHPVEQGVSFVDHVQPEPFTLQLEGIISNTPMSMFGVQLIKSVSNFAQGKTNNRAQLLYEEIESLVQNGEPIVIATSLKEYSNMVLENFSVERTSNSSQSLHFNVSAKQIRVVNQLSIADPQTKNKRTKKNKNLGKVDTKETTPEQKKKTISMIEQLQIWAGG